MDLAIVKLIKFSELEEERNYDNRSVFGGFGNIRSPWEKEALNQNVPQDIVSKICELLDAYPDQTIEERQSTITTLLSLLRGYANKENIPLKKSKPFEKSKVKEIKSSDRIDKSQPFRGLSSQPAQKETPADVDLADIHKGLSAPVQTIKGIGDANASALAKLNIRMIKDLLFFFPKRYEDFRNLKTINRLKYGEQVTLIAAVKSIHTRTGRNGKMKITEVILDDNTGTLRASFFNQEHLDKVLHTGDLLKLFGKIEMYLGRLVMNSPKYIKLEKEELYKDLIHPIYPLTQGLSQRMVQDFTQKAVRQWAMRIPDPLPADIRSSLELLPLSKALYNIHTPSDMEMVKEAQQRLSFDEIFFLQLGVLKEKQNWQSVPAEKLQIDDETFVNFYDRLPFPLTNAQLNAIKDIRKDFSNGIPMSRLLQGDVGSGKTLVAAISMAIAVVNNVQSTIMAPTSILAEQHYKNLQKYFEPLNIIAPNQIRLLIGDTPEIEKEEIRSGLRNGDVKIIIGTHALIESPVEFANLQFVVIDEQHRFGVEQRAKLREKGNNPHLLVMTATPIPRSLALTLYGDLDLTIMDEMPPGRKPVKTFILHPLDRERAYRLIRKEIQSGRQAFIIYPLVETDEEEEESIPTNAAVNEHTRLQSMVFPGMKVGLLHGKLPPAEKDQIMQAFRNREFDILVATTVIEVGVDIPNASVILIEGADRFGLAQLHQLRGRVGRGQEDAFCLLIPESEDAVENERLKAMEESNDGFFLAEKDLQQRGPGDFLGTRQAGFMELQLANIMDIGLIEKARKHAEAIFEQDSSLEFPEHAEIRRILDQYWKTGTGDIS